MHVTRTITTFIQYMGSRSYRISYHVRSIVASERQANTIEWSRYSGQMR